MVCPGTGPFREQLQHDCRLHSCVEPSSLEKNLRTVSARIGGPASGRAHGSTRSGHDPCERHLVGAPHREGVASRRSNPVPIMAHVRQEIEPAKVRRYGLDRVEAVIAISRQVEQSLIAGGVSANMFGLSTAASIFPGIIGRGSGDSLR